MVTSLVAAGAATVILVDGENVPPTLAGQIMQKTRAYGPAMVARVYGDVTRLSAWAAEAGFEMVHTGHAKNGADMRICIDALDLAARGGVGRVVIASSDRDFTHLAQYLRARGIEVVGMGEGKTHATFRKACSHFVELGGAVKPAPKTTEDAPQRGADHRVKALISQAGEQGISLSKLGTEMLSAHQTRAKALGHRSWGQYLLAFPNDFVVSKNQSHFCVRLK